MMDNRKLQNSRQKGIERVKQRKGDMEKGQGGKMHNKPREKARSGKSGK